MDKQWNNLPINSKFTLAHEVLYCNNNWGWGSPINDGFPSNWLHGLVKLLPMVTVYIFRGHNCSGYSQVMTSPVGRQTLAASSPTTPTILELLSIFSWCSMQPRPSLAGWLVVPDLTWIRIIIKPWFRGSLLPVLSSHTCLLLRPRC